MSFQENKFPILLGAVTAVVTGGLIFWSMKSGGKYEEAKSDYDNADRKIGQLMRVDPKPTEGNQVAKKQAVDAYAESVAKLQEAFDPRRATKLQNIEPSAFTDSLLSARKRVLAEFEKSGTTVPEQFFLGHGRFSDTLPQKKDTGVLSYQLGAFEDLLTKLAQAAPTALTNIYWAGVPEVPEGAAVVPHPIEITFRGPESSLREFLSSLDDTGKYYYVVRTMRVMNERDSAPNAQDARFERVVTPTPDLGGPGSIFGDPGGFVFPEEDGLEDLDSTEDPADGGAEGEGEGEGLPVEEVPAPPAPAPEPAAPTDSGEILKQVLGDEKIQVFLRIDVLQFLEPRELPQ
ncbi:Amuc_1100 family pilus-like protein [Haloferula sp. A504]|uniref:Amuc_1100 family pilus-like protein n=1 Tax=Haloferula sp. A504 TaxID=3373601 RepID=UPI0031C220A5|nr:Amuc_1100 family pilus-like protein [Verrucomicrobiaceae bacterium E54]